MSKIKINRQYKDRLFCFLFGREEYKENALLLYNALMETNYHDVNTIEITTIDDVIYINMKNDVSLLVDSGYLSLFEQQSTFNPNMPLRGFMYFGKLYDSYVVRKGLNIYGEKMIRIPTPIYFVLYNGTSERDAIEKLHLSDAFINPCETGAFEWTATMVNINNNKNDNILEKCKPLHDYMTLVNRIRDNQEIMDVNMAVNMAVDSCIKDDVLREFLMKHKTEVVGMCLNEFNEKIYTEGIREEGRKEGRKEGREEERIRLISLLLDNEVALQQLGATAEEIARAKKLSALIGD